MCCNHSKIWTMWLYHRVMCPKDADGMANSVAPDQTAPESALFAQAYLSKNLGSLRYRVTVFWYQVNKGDQNMYRASMIWSSLVIKDMYRNTITWFPSYDTIISFLRSVTFSSRNEFKLFCKSGDIALYAFPCCGDVHSYLMLSARVRLNVVDLNLSCGRKKKKKKQAVHMVTIALLSSVVWSW